MKCEEFEFIGLDLERGASLSEVGRAAVQQHAGSCPRCAALLESWQSARRELLYLADATASAEAPARVEMRLRQEFRTQHHTIKVRRAALIAAWALAAAAVLLGVVSWNSWRNSTIKEASIHLKSPQTPAGLPANGAAANSASDPEPAAAAAADARTLTASNELSGFTLLPGVLPVDTDDAEILRVRMQRGALESLGLPVNEERAGDWIQVDLLVGMDGSPQAVRLPQEH